MMMILIDRDGGGGDSLASSNASEYLLRMKNC